jgi:hypothetical protein
MSTPPRRPQPPKRDYHCTLDFRGETLTYTRGDRSVEMECTWATRYCIDARTIRQWKTPGGDVPVTREERAEIVRHVVEYSAAEQNVTMHVIGGEEGAG